MWIYVFQYFLSSCQCYRQTPRSCMILVTNYLPQRGYLHHFKRHEIKALILRPQKLTLGLSIAYAQVIRGCMTLTSSYLGVVQLLPFMNLFWGQTIWDIGDYYHPVWDLLSSLSAFRMRESHEFWHCLGHWVLIALYGYHQKETQGACPLAQAMNRSVQ